MGASPRLLTLSSLDHTEPVSGSSLVEVPTSQQNQATPMCTFVRGLMFAPMPVTILVLTINHCLTWSFYRYITGIVEGGAAAKDGRLRVRISPTGACVHRHCS
jgi:hypothetical protein